MQHSFRHFCSRLFAKLANSRVTIIKKLLIKTFIFLYKPNLHEALYQDIKFYQSFNQFFTRELKPGVRIICPEDGVCISPVDGKIQALGQLQKTQFIQAKNVNYSLEELVGILAPEVSKTFEDGQYMVIYLGPQDYHRVHMPCAGRLLKTAYIPGGLYSVNPNTVAKIPKLFAKNERLVCYFEDSFGQPFMVIFIGAIFVSGIKTIWHELYTAQQACYENLEQAPLFLDKAMELGHFEFGSTVILLYPKDRLQWEGSLEPNNLLKVGEKVGKFF